MQNQTTVDTSHHRYDRNNDPHVRAIDRLVHELGLSAEEVNRSYREVLEELKKDINVTTVLPILVSRAAKERLLQRQ